MFLKIVYPAKPTEEYECDSIHLPLEDGDMGVRQGHESCIAALGCGRVKALLAEEEVCSFDIKSGLASIDGCGVTLFDSTAEQSV